MIALPIKLYVGWGGKVGLVVVGGDILAARTPLCTRRVAVLFAKPEHELQDANRNRAQISGLSTFNPFSGENAFQVDTKTRLGSKFLPGIWALFL